MARRASSAYYSFMDQVRSKILEQYTPQTLASEILKKERFGLQLYCKAAKRECSIFSGTATLSLPVAGETGNFKVDVEMSIQVPFGSDLLDPDSPTAILNLSDVKDLPHLEYKLLACTRDYSK